MRGSIPCVGLIVLVGCLTLIIAPDPLEQPGKVILPRERLPIVVVDPGHGGNDDGAKRAGVMEKSETLDIAKKLNALLRQYGFRTVMTRETDRYVSLSERVAVANQLENALFVSIHFNDSGDRSAEGVETYYSAQKAPAQSEWTWVGLFSDASQLSEESESLAGYIQVAIISRTNTQDRGIKSSRLYVTRNTRCPAVLIEAGFLSNALERQLVNNDDYRARLAGGIASGIMEFVKSQRQVPAPVLASANRKEFVR